jgi:hypothetical protein
MEEIVKKAIENELLKKPSQGFTDKVMNEIFELKSSFETKPLISSGVWFVIGSLILALMVLVFLLNPQSTDKYQIPVLNKIESFLSSVHLPSFDCTLNINLYVIVGAFLALMLLTIFDVVLFKKK